LLSLSLSLLLVQTNNALQVYFAGNVSAEFDINANAGDWGYRRTAVGLIDLGALYDAAWFSSISAGGTKYSAQGDAIWGAVSVEIGNGMPVSYLAYWAANVSVADGNDALTMDVSTAKGLIANCYVAIVERDANGNDVKVLSLADTLFNLNWEIVDHSAGDATLQYVTFGGSDRNEPYSINITFVVSDVIGVLAQGGGTVSPKSLESIIQIGNWQYQEAANTLTLVTAVATGSVSKSVDRKLLVSGSADSQVYFSVAPTAVVDGQNKSVSVSTFIDGNIDVHFNNANIKQQLQARYGNNFVVKVVNITFPAGSENILYDPTAGAGTPVQPASSNAVVVVANVVFMVVMALVVLL